MITSVREAKKSTQLNHYIFVFTVVTIFYLPLSFIAVSRPALCHTSLSTSDQMNTRRSSPWTIFDGTTRGRSYHLIRQSR